MENYQRRIGFYQTERGQQPVTEWLDNLRDRKGRAQIRSKMDRLNLGNCGGCKSLGGGLYELRIDFGPGYRVYFADAGNLIILLLCGGDKSTQEKDIEVARKYLSDYKKRTDENKAKR